MLQEVTGSKGLPPPWYYVYQLGASLHLPIEIERWMSSNNCQQNESKHLYRSMRSFKVTSKDC